MERQEQDSFLDGLIQMLNKGGQAAAVLDTDFTVLWYSTAAPDALPGIALPDGVRTLLRGYDPVEVRGEIESRGSFSTPADHNLFTGRSITLYSLPDGSGRYLLRPSSALAQGSGLRPAGIARTVSLFGSQYRTPLTVIFSMLTLLSKTCKPGATPEELGRAEDYLRTINDNTYRLLRSCEWISDYAQLAYGIAPMRVSRVDLRQFLQELLDAAAVHLESVGIPLTYDLPDASLVVICDTDRLSSVLLNLLSNSARYTRPDNHIEIRVRKRSGIVSISCIDRGLGIPTEIQSRVFDPYFSYDHEGRPFAGSGLGLAIVKTCVASMGGTVTLISSEDKGTTIVFTLPTNGEEDAPTALESTSADYLNDRFSPLFVALADSVKPPF